MKRTISLRMSWSGGLWHVWMVLLTLLIAYACRAEEVPSAVAIKDAKVVTARGPELAKATVLLRDGLIEDVGPDLTIPADAWVIDGSGLTVYPGFISGLSAWGLPASPPAVSTGATGPPVRPTPRSRGPEDRPKTNSYQRAADIVGPGDKRLTIARAAGFTTSATFPETGIFGGQGAMIDFAGKQNSEWWWLRP